MNYKKLSNEYFEESEFLKNYIKDLKIKLNYKNLDAENTETRYRLKILYEIFTELKEVSTYLNTKQSGYENNEKKIIFR